MIDSLLGRIQLVSLRAMVFDPISHSACLAILSAQTHVLASPEKVNPAGQRKILTTILMGVFLLCIPGNSLRTVNVIAPLVSIFCTRMSRVKFIQL